MNLYVLRHAVAREKSEWKKADSDRPLTDDGRRKLKKALKGFRSLELSVDWVLTSPYRRAYDTAWIAAKALHRKKNLRVLKSLAPDGDPKILVRHLAQNFKTWESVMLVGHDPYLSRLIGILAAGNAQMGLALDKGGLAKLSADALAYGPCARLEWIVPAKALRRLA